MLAYGGLDDLARTPGCCIWPAVRLADRAPEQLVEVAREHIQREDEYMRDANRYLFVDTDATTTRMFSLYYHGQVHPELDQLADHTRNRYNLFFLCDDDIPYQETWDRSGLANRTLFQKQIKADLIQRRIPYITLQGSPEARIRKVKAVLDGFDRYRSIGDCLLNM